MLGASVLAHPSFLVHREVLAAKSIGRFAGIAAFEAAVAGIDTVCILRTKVTCCMGPQLHVQVQLRLVDCHPLRIGDMQALTCI